MKIEHYIFALISLTMAGCSVPPPEGYRSKALTGAAAIERLVDIYRAEEFLNTHDAYYLTTGGIGGSTAFLAFTCESEEVRWSIIKRVCDSLPRNFIAWQPSKYKAVMEGPGVLGADRLTNLWNVGNIKDGLMWERITEGSTNSHRHLSMHYCAIDLQNNRVYILVWIDDFPDELYEP